MPTYPQPRTNFVLNGETTYNPSYNMIPADATELGTVTMGSVPY